MQRLIFTEDVSPEKLKYLVSIGSYPVVYVSWIDIKLGRIRKSPLVLCDDINFKYLTIQILEILPYIETPEIRSYIFKHLMGYLFYYEIT